MASIVRLMKTTPLFLVLAWCAGARLVAATPTWTGDPALGARELEKQWPQVADANHTLPIRGTLRFALEATGLGWHPDHDLRSMVADAWTFTRLAVRAAG